MNIDKGLITDLGVYKVNKGCNLTFSINNEKNEKCFLLLYDEAGKEKYRIRLKDQWRIGSTYSVFIEGEDLYRLRYRIMVGSKKKTDIYAPRIYGMSQWKKKKSEVFGGFVNHEAYNWEDDKKPCINDREAVIYKLNVRGFTMDNSSKVVNKGSFKGVTEKIPHLKELGINRVELMPCYEFSEIIPQKKEGPKTEPKVRYDFWGYRAGYYFAPKSAYCATDNPAEEFKDMVKALHKEGIEVIMEFHFTEEVNPELIVSCIRYWVINYHIDGVHLNSGVSPMYMLANDPYLTETGIYSEDFPCSKTSNPKLYRYHDGFMVAARKFIKGDDGILTDIVGRIDYNDPVTHVNYVADHNGFTLNDMVSYNRKHNESNGFNNRDGYNDNYSWNCGHEGSSRSVKVNNLRIKQMKNALMLTVLAEGVPLIRAGDELCNSQRGNNNAFCIDNSISWVNWNENNKSREIFDFLKELISIRKKYFTEKNSGRDEKGFPALSYHGEQAFSPSINSFDKKIGILYSVKTGKNKDSYLYLALNMHWDSEELACVHLPEGSEYKLLISSDSNIKKGEKTIEMPPRSCALFIAEEKAVNIKEKQKNKNRLGRNKND